MVASFIKKEGAEESVRWAEETVARKVRGLFVKRDIFSLIYIHLPVEFYIFFLHLLALLLATYCENTDARTVDDVG